MQARTDERITVTFECVAEKITTDLSRCSRNRQDCQHGLPAGYSSTYCLHPDHYLFRLLSDKRQ